MTFTTKTSLAFAITLGLFASALLFSSLLASYAGAAAPSGLQAIVSTSSNPTVTTTAAIVFATTTQCSSRVVTTYASPIMLTFSDNQGKTPTGTYGHLQLASTTVAYDSGIYGCGAYKVYSFVSQAITVTETL